MCVFGPRDDRSCSVYTLAADKLTQIPFILGEQVPTVARTSPHPLRVDVAFRRRVATPQRSSSSASTRYIVRSWRVQTMPPRRRGIQSEASRNRGTMAPSEAIPQPW